MNYSTIPTEIQELKAWSIAQPYPEWKRINLPSDLFAQALETPNVCVTGESSENSYFPMEIHSLEDSVSFPLDARVLKRLRELRDLSIVKGIGNKFTSFAMTHFNQGAMIIGQPKQHTQINVSHTLEGTNLVSHYLVYAPKNSKMEVIFDYREGEASSKLYSQVVLLAEPGSDVKLVNVQRLNAQTQSFQNIYALAEEGAQVVIGDLQLGSDLKASNVYKRLEGHRTQGEIYTLYYTAEKAQADLSYTLNHVGKKTNGHILSKGAMSKQSKKVFRGNLIFDTGATQSVSKEEEFCMLLADQIKADSIPGLFCAEDDVIGEHAASIGQIDEDRLFYLQSRGFSLTAARKLVIRGAYEEVLLKLNIPELTSNVQSTLDRLLESGREI